MRRPDVSAALLLVGVLIWAICQAGCGPSRAPTGKVSGKVTLEGQPLTSGLIQFSSEKLGAGASADLDAAGTYKIDVPLPVGLYEVAVQPPPLPAPHEMQQPITAPRTKIPARYQDPKTSGLTATINEGTNTADFAL